MGADNPVDPGAQDTTTKSEVDILADETEDTTEDTDTVVADEETSDEPETEDAEESEGTEEESEEVGTEEETETEEEEEDTEEETQEFSRPSWAKIKKEYPQLAKDKDFKQLYFRDAVLTELFPTVAEAKEVKTKAATFDELDSALVAGDVDRVVGSLNPEILEKFSERILPALFQADKKFFQRATQPVVIDILNNAMDWALENKDENMQKSVRNVAYFLTGKKDIPQRMRPASENPEVKAEIEKYRAERIKLFKTNEKSFLVDVDNKSLRKIQQLIEADIDPKKELTPFAKRAVAERTLKDIQTKLSSDEGLTGKVKQLHKEAARKNFIDVDILKSRIIAASLDRARKLIPSIRNKHKMDALGRQPSKEPTKIKADLGGNKEIKTTGGGRVTSIRQIDTSRTSPEDFLSGKVVMRK